MAHNYEIRESPGRGLGSFALVDIPRGTRLTFEKPLLITGTDENGQYAARTTFEAFQAMSKSKQEAYLKLHPSPRVFEEFRSGIQIDAGGMTKEMKEYIAYICAIRSANSYGHGVYELASRFNHSCTPNCNASGNSAETICVHSVRDVKAGEELTVYYMDPEQTREARQEFLVNYGFVCDCPACDLSTPQGKRSEERRAQIWRLKQDVNFMKERDWNKVVGPYAPSVSTLSGNSDPESALRTLESLLKEEGLVGNNLSAWYQFGFYYQMTEVTKMSPGDEGGASLRQQGFAWGEKALENDKHVCGEDSENYQSILQMLEQLKEKLGAIEY